jgi:hypothetical protein
MRIRASEAAEIGTLAGADAGHEKRHIGLLRVRGPVQADRQ